MLILYDYLLTFDAEVKYFWSTKTTGALVLFISNRYLNLVAQCCFGIIGINATSSTAEVPIDLS